MIESSSSERKAGVTLIDVACVFAVLSVVGWQVVPYLLVGSLGFFALLSVVVAAVGFVRLVWLLSAGRQER